MSDGKKDDKVFLGITGQSEQEVLDILKRVSVGTDPDQVRSEMSRKDMDHTDSVMVVIYLVKK